MMDNLAFVNGVKLKDVTIKMTDENVTLGVGNDLIYGWTVGAGNAHADQADLAPKA